MKLSAEELDGIRKRLAAGDLAVRWHHLKAFGRSSAQGYASLLNLAPERSSSAMESGEAVDAELLDGVDGNVISVPDGMRRDERTEAYQSFKAANPGKLILSGSEYAKVGQMVASVREHAEAMSLLGGVRKQSILWQKEDGIRCRATPDSHSPVALVDLKRTAQGNCTADRFSKHARRMGWLGQLAYYYEAMVSVGSAPDIYFVVVEAEPTLVNRRHEVAIFRMGDQAHDEAHDEVERLWKLLLRFLDDGEVHGYGSGLPIEIIPAWKEFE